MSTLMVEKQHVHTWEPVTRWQPMNRWWSERHYRCACGATLHRVSVR